MSLHHSRTGVTDHHHAVNRGSVPVVINLATLFRDGEPPSLPN
jgi:hypothetical protein